MSKYNIIWIDDDIESIKDRHEAYKSNLGDNIHVEFFAYFDDANKYYDENFKDIHGIILDFRAMNNQRDTSDSKEVGQLMINEFLKKCSTNDLMIPICFSTAVPDEISPSMIRMYQKQHEWDHIAVFDKDHSIKMFEWMNERVRKVYILASNKYINILDKYLSEGSNNARMSFSNMQRNLQKDRIYGSDFNDFGKYIESLLNKMPFYTNMPEKVQDIIYGEKTWTWSQMNLSQKIFFLGDRRDKSLPETVGNNGKKYPSKGNAYLNCNKYDIAFNPVIHHLLDAIREIKNSIGSHEVTSKNPYQLDKRQYSILFSAFKEVLLWFDHIYKDKFEQKYGE